MRADFFWKPESNRVHPSERPSREATVEVPDGLEPWDMIRAARVPVGSTRTGVHEIQTDHGVWTRTSPNRRARSTWSFTSWADLEAADALTA